MSRPQISSEENIVRAIHKAWWDEQTNRKDSSIFRDSRNKLSVSRLSILNLPELFVIFHKELDTSPNGVIIGAGEINVGHLQKIGKEFLDNPTIITVEEDPMEGNPAHAEIPQKISRGLAKKIISELLFHKDKNID